MKKNLSGKVSIECLNRLKKTVNYIYLQNMHDAFIFKLELKKSSEDDNIRKA